MVARVNFIQPRAEHARRAPAGFERAAVCGGVYAARQPGDDSHPARGQVARQHQRHVLPVGRAAARADQGDAGRFEALGPAPAHVERDGRVGNLAQKLRVRAVVKGEHVRAFHLAHALKLARRLLVPVAQGD